MPFTLINPSTWNVLLTDDEADSNNVLSIICNFHGVQVRSASNGKNCLAQLNSQLPDILFLDIQMPVMSGWEVIECIRGDPNLKHLPVIALTAYAMAGDRERIMAAGFNGYFAKPIDPMTIIQDVIKILQNTPTTIPTPDKNG